MIKSKGRRITWFVLTLILAMGMVGSSVALAAPDYPEPKAKDNSTEQRMKDSNNTATIRWSKTYNKLGSAWPDKDNFQYVVSKVSFWDNSNADTDKNGKEKTTDDMPFPVKEGVVSTGTPADGYKDGESATLSRIITVPVSDTKDNNTTEAKGVQPSDFTFERPGYYVYKVREVNDGVSGVKYDKHVYYLAFYVANKTAGGEHDGATVGGDVDETGTNLYVHTITAWRSQATGDTTDAQILEQIVIPKSVDPAFETSNKYFLKVKATTDEKLAELKTAYAGKFYAYKADNDDLSKATPLADASVVKDTTYWVEVDQAKVDAAVAKGEIGKTNRSQDKNEGDQGPNKLQVEFWNEADIKDVTVEKKVTGTLGDLQKEFEFTVEVTGLKAGVAYEVSATPADKAASILDNTKNKAGKKYADGTDVPANDASAVLAKGSDDKYTYTAKADGTAKFKVVLKANQSICIKGLPTNATYKVTEEASDHAASYAVTSSNKKTADGEKAIIASESGSNNGAKDTDLSTAEESVDPTDEAITITYTNHRDFETETGIPSFVFPIVLAAMLALIGLAVVRRRKDVASVNDFEF